MKYNIILKILVDGLIALLCGIAIVAAIIGASIQHQDRSSALAVMEVGG